MLIKLRLFVLSDRLFDKVAWNTKLLIAIFHRMGLWALCCKTQQEHHDPFRFPSPEVPGAAYRATKQVAGLWGCSRRSALLGLNRWWEQCLPACAAAARHWRTPGKGITAKYRVCLYWWCWTRQQGASFSSYADNMPFEGENVVKSKAGLKLERVSRTMHEDDMRYWWEASTLNVISCYTPIMLFHIAHLGVS